MQLVEAARCSVLPDWKWHIVSKAQNDLEDNYHIWQHWEGSRPMTVLSRVRACARRWNVRKIPFPKLVRAYKLVCEGPRKTKISDEAKSRTILQSLPDACPGKRGRLVTPPKKIL